MRYRTQIPVLLALFIMALAGCGQVAPGGAAAPTVGSAAPAVAGPVTPVFAFSEATAGKNRIAIGLVRSNTPVNDPAAQVHLRFFNLDETNPQVKFEADATYYGQGLPAAVYVAYPSFDQAGNWGVEIQVRLAGQAEPTISKQRLEVRPGSAVPNIGQPAPATRTLTVKDVPAVAQLSSEPTPDPALYQISLDQALSSGRPTALLFGTPAYCRTATCGPSLEVLKGLQKRFGSQVNFIHVEVYKYPFDQSVQQQEQAVAQATKENRPLTAAEAATGLADAMVAWQLQSEPWLYLIDAQGIIAGRYEGGLTGEELGPAIERLIAGQAVF